ncbi:MAG: mechanosensitive ion channel protein [Deltaproteobacteria bacterium]|nr:MAG: mechanosensitive ion channel protein [Deltaproteobacteria bacterium]
METFSDYVTYIAEHFRSIWSIELFKSGDNVVRLNQIVIAFIIVIIGGLFAKLLARLIGRKIVSLGHIPKHTAYLIQRTTHYFLLLVVVLVALPVAGIPITIFTVLGGALAIGVGFGAQNLFNNLISGFIILFEQPIRPGDVVEIDSQEGLVEEIGGRRVLIRRTDGANILVPNSHFLEQKVVNWTLDDNLVRGKIEVGVAYGSDAKAVEEILKKLVGEHPRIVKSPLPVILFKSFGDNALLFETLFWAPINRPMDLRIIESELRFEIDSAFKEAGIVIAFPQRDIHFDKMSPLEVSLIRKDK